MNPAQIIANQLGGVKFLTSNGFKNIFSTDNGQTLSLHLPANKLKAKYLSISLTLNDDYNVTFSTIKGKKHDETLVEIARFQGIYNDMLQELIFTEMGLIINVL